MGGVVESLKSPWLKTDPPELPPPPPPPPTIDDASEAQSSRDAARRRRGSAASILTSPEGVTAPTPVGKKTLLGS